MNKFHKPCTLTMQGFKSFKEEQVFTFPDESSKLYFITGRNEVEPALEANGVGKSTLLDAIIYVLYNKTSRGLKASDIESWGGRGCLVTYEFYVNEDHYVISRTRSPITLTLNKNNEGPKVVEQSDIDALVGLDYNSFLYAVIFSQFCPSFFDLKPSDKTELFTSILNLDYWVELSNKAKKEANFFAGFVHDVDKDVAELVARISESEKRDYKEELQRWNEVRDNEVVTLKDKTKAISIRLKTLKEEGEQLIEDKKSISAKIEQSQVVYREIVQLKDEVENELSDFDRKIAVANHSIKVAEKDKQQIDVLGGVCSTCKQKIDEAHKDKELEKVEKSIKQFKSQVQEYNEQTTQLREDFGLVKYELERVKNELASNKESLSEKDYQLSIRKRDSKQLMIELNELREKITKLELQSNPYIEKQQKHNEYIVELKKQLEENKVELNDLKVKVERANYWVKGFKQVRFYIVQNVLEQLEVEVNSCLFQLGLEDWKVKFAMEQETKSNTVRKGFAVMIYSPYNSEPVPWEAWSGGESQRLRIAGMLGFSNLLLARSGVSFAYEMYDEPSSWLSPRGIQDLIEVLHNRAKTENKQVWIIDHRSLEFSFDGVVTIVKTPDGSEITNE